MAPPGYTEFSSHRLPNGLQVILHRNTSAPLVAVMVMYHVGSKNERPGKTGFAHLFEHIMFKGSAHVADGEHFRLLQEIGAMVNGSTTEDRTNYYEIVPSAHLDLALSLEADRMGFLLPALSQEKLDNQRDVVKNERRQSYDNQPYGRAQETILANLFPANHPYGWPVIGSMEDLAAASLEDVRAFFRTYYTPANACLVLAGDLEPGAALSSVERTFGPLPGSPPPPNPIIPASSLPSPARLSMSDRVHVPRLYMAWHGPAVNSREDAILDLLTNHLSVGRNSRLHRSLVYRDQIAQSVVTYQDGMEKGGITAIVATAQRGKNLKQLEEAVVRELEEIAREGLSPEEFETALNAAEMDMMQGRISSFHRANGLATYHTLTGDAMNFNSSLRKFEGITGEELQHRTRQLLNTSRVVLSVVPQESPELAAENSKELAG
jgi:zinc protease